MQVGTDFGWYLKIPGYRGTWTVSKRHNDYSWFKLGWHYQVVLRNDKGIKQSKQKLLAIT